MCCAKETEMFSAINYAAVLRNKSEKKFSTFLVTIWWTSFFPFAVQFNVIWMEDFWRASANANGWKLSKRFYWTADGNWLVPCRLNLETSINELEQKRMCHIIVKPDVWCSDSFNESIKTSGFSLKQFLAFSFFPLSSTFMTHDDRLPP